MADEEIIEAEAPEGEDTQPDSSEGVDANAASSDEAEGDGGEGSEGVSVEPSVKGTPAPAKDETQEIAAIIERTLRANQTQAERAAAAASERERLALMTPEQKDAYSLKQEIQELKREQVFTRIQTAENMDRMSIKSDQKLSPLYRKYESQVEEKIKELRAQNNFSNREAVLRWVLGGVMVDSYKSSGPSRQKSAGAANLEKSTARPTVAKGQVKLNGKSDPSGAGARAERLANIRI